MIPRTWQGRRARPASAGYPLLKTAGQIVLLWTIFFGVLPAVLVHIELHSPARRYRFAHPRSRWVGRVLFMVAGLSGLASGVVMTVAGQGTPLPMDCPRQLVIAGPYRYVRNPMALTGLLQALAVGLYRGSPTVLVYALIGALGWNYGIRPWEEQDLRRRFGPRYNEYHAQVRCWIPRRPVAGR